MKLSINANVDGVYTADTTQVNTNTIHMEEVTNVPASTPIVLKASAGTYYLPVITTATDDVTDNKLLASDGTVTGNGYIYALGKNNDEVGFYLVKSGSTVLEGKAYLSIGSPVKEFLGFNFDVETAITETAEKSECTENLFDLSGRRVSKAQKGLYIVNGRKVLVK